MSVRKVVLEEPVPVYDITVPGTKNFMLDSGAFVHNSKDCADAVAGVVYILTKKVARTGSRSSRTPGTSRLSGGTGGRVRQVRTGKRGRVRSRLV